MSDSSHKKVSNSLVALSSAAVLAVYTAGYLRTKSAADRFTLQAEARRPVIPAAPPVVQPGPVNVATLPAWTAVSPAPKASPRADRNASESAAQPARAIKKAPRVASAPVTKETTPPAPVASSPAPVAALPAAVVEQAIATPPPVAPEPPKPQYKDGTYFGWGTSRHGDIQAQVIIQDGRIASATIAQCLTRYSCSVIARLPPQVAERQSPETDYVSGATQSTNAFYYAVVEALSKAK